MGNKEENLGPTYTVLRYEKQIPLDYLNFVFSKWMRSYRFGNDFMKLVESDHYFKSYELYIANILARPNTVLRIAALSDNHDVALGFSVVRDHVLDYVHVHKDFRKQGMGKKLVPPGIIAFTHLTKTGMKLWPTRMPRAKFTPFA